MSRTKRYECCATCGAGALVTQTITGYPIPEEDQYYQCLSGVEGECGTRLEYEADYAEVDTNESME